MTVADITNSLCAGTPPALLYHYTSVGSTLGIVESQVLRATEVRYFSDAAEMRHALDLLKAAITLRVANASANSKLLNQLNRWLSHRLTFGHMIFVVSFSANGNLLSQWRSYCPAGKGVSLGFRGDKLRASASAQSFQLVRCTYDLPTQQKSVEAILDAVESLGLARGENSDARKRHPTESFYGVFEEVEADLLRFAALLKHPSFHEEEEWRIVSQAVTNYVTADIEYREGASTLVPFIKFKLPYSTDRRVELERVYLGPTPSVGNSMSSLGNYLSKHGASPRNGTIFCDIPYRSV
jgi:Protein of unknown function (DUF2971)